MSISKEVVIDYQILEEISTAKEQNLTQSSRYSNKMKLVAG